METERLGTDETGIARAARLLAAGELVAFPTETVYGLGADATNDLAVAKVFEAKGRPSFNPLIAHVPTLAAAERIGHLPDAARALVADGWPAGLTLVVPLREKSGLSRLVTSGQPSVALRVPASSVAQALLAAFGGPVAAPSANPSGRISPTTADHVLKGLDGAPTPAGLESTILAFEATGPVVLREGVYPVAEDLPRATDLAPDATAARAPGMLGSHYAPKGRLRMNVTSAAPGEWYIGFGPCERCDANLSPPGDLREAAANLFALLHDADDKPEIAIAPVPDTGLGRAINDRLRRAAAPR